MPDLQELSGNARQIARSVQRGRHRSLCGVGRHQRKGGNRGGGRSVAVSRRLRTIARADARSGPVHFGASVATGDGQAVPRARTVRDQPRRSGADRRYFQRAVRTAGPQCGSQWYQIREGEALSYTWNALVTNGSEMFDENPARLTPAEIAAAQPARPPIDQRSALLGARRRMLETGQWTASQFMGRRWPIGCVALEITQRCNLDCTACYLSENSESVRDLPLREVFRRIDVIFDHYGRDTDVHVTGGDPTLREKAELVEIVRRIRQQ